MSLPGQGKDRGNGEDQRESQPEQRRDEVSGPGIVREPPGDPGEDEDGEPAEQCPASAEAAGRLAQDADVPAVVVQDTSDGGGLSRVP